MKKLTVGQKLGGAFGMLILISLLGSAISITNFLRLNKANEWNIHSYSVLRASDSMMTSMLNMETGMRGYVLSGNEARLAPYQEGLSQFEKSYALIHSLTADNAAQQQRLDTLKQLRQEIGDINKKLIALRQDVNAGKLPQNAPVDYFKQSKQSQLMNHYRSIAAELVSSEQSLLDQRSKEVAAMTSSTMFSLAAASLVTIALAIVLGILITRSIIRSLGGEPDEAASVTSRIAQGDLSMPVPTKGNDRTSLMASLEMMRQKLKDIVSGIQTSAETIKSSAGEIAQGNLDLSQRTGEQASALEETAASMEELTSTVRQNIDNSKQANRLATNACDVAVRGGTVVGQAIESMQSISESSNKVSEIIAVIEGITFQTNILALNAAVEAARAGEHGRGFAVVAGEVRALAQRSASAAKEIKELIEHSTGQVATGAEQVNRAGTTMSEIVQSVRQVTDIMGEIASASEEQGMGIEQVNTAVSQIDVMTQQNAALVEQASAAAKTMAEQAATLRDAVRFFRIETGTFREPKPETIDRFATTSTRRRSIDHAMA